MARSDRKYTAGTRRLPGRGMYLMKDAAEKSKTSAGKGFPRQGQRPVRLKTGLASAPSTKAINEANDAVFRTVKATKRKSHAQGLHGKPVETYRRAFHR